MADSSVTIRVRLTDDGQVKTSLRAVGEQGKAAADQIKAAMAGINFSHATAEANKLSAALAGMARPLTAIGVAFGTFAGQIGAQIAAGLAQIPHAFNEIIAKAAATNKEMQDFADQVGSSVEEISGVISGLANFGVAMESIETLLKRLSVTVQEEWPKIAKEVRDATEQQKTDILKVEDAQIKLIEATQKSALAQSKANLAVAQSQQKLSEIETQAARQGVDNATKAISNANSIRGAQLGLIDARVRLHELVTGEKLPPEVTRALEIEKAKLEVQERREKLAELIRQRERDEQDAADKAAQIEQQLEAARIAAIEARQQKELTARKDQREEELALLNLDKARGEQLERNANSIIRIKGEVEKLASGQKTEGDLSADQIVRGVIASTAAKGAEAIGQFGDSFAEIGAKAPSLLPVMFKLADVLKATGDRALATAVLVKLFGKAVSGDLVDAMLEGSEALKAEAEEMKKVGLAATKEDAAVGERFVKSRNRFFNHLELLKNKVGTEFARFPGFATWDKLLLENQESVRKWAQTLGQLFDSVSFALGNLLTGKSFEQFAAEFRDKMSPEQLLQVKSWMEAFETIKKGLLATWEVLKAIWAFIQPIITAFAAIIEAAAVAGRAIGEIFGAGDFGANAAVVLALGLIIASLKAIPALALTAGTALLGLLGLASRLAILLAPLIALAATLKPTAVEAGATEAARLQAGIAADKLKELNEEFKDKSSEEYKRRVAELRDEFNGLTAAFRTSDPLGALKIFGEIDKLLANIIGKIDELKTKTGEGGADKSVSEVEQKFAALKKGAELTGIAFSNVMTDPGVQAALSKIYSAGVEIDRIKVSAYGVSSAIVEIFDASGKKITEIIKLSLQDLETLKRTAPDIAQQIAGKVLDIDALNRGEGSGASKNVIDVATMIAEAQRQAIDILMRPVGDVTAKGEALAEEFGALTAAANAAAAALNRIPAVAPTGRAAGGMISGRGTGTSDSILARLSNGEFVMNARSVSHYGAPFMRAVNSGRFALGGLVEGLTSIMPPSGLPRFAEGGMAHGMNNVTIEFPGLPAIGGLRASSDVVEELRKAAVLAQVRSGGRKPSRYS